MFACLDLGESKEKPEFGAIGVMIGEDNSAFLKLVFLKTVS